MWRPVLLCICFVLAVGSYLQLANPRGYRPLSDEYTRQIYGGDEYDDYALCDGSQNCVQCTPNTCTTSPSTCTIDVAGNDGCTESTGTDSYCNSFSWNSDCEYKGGVQSCGGPSNRRKCNTMSWPACAGWGSGGNPAGCVAGTLSVQQCQNCATIP